MPSPEEGGVFDAAALAIRGDAAELRIRLRVVPGARREAILGGHGEALRVAVRAAPEQGRANRAVEELLAARLGLPRSAVAVERGAASRDKVVRLSGLGPDELRRRLQAAVEPRPISASSGARRRRSSSPGA